MTAVDRARERYLLEEVKQAHQEANGIKARIAEVERETATIRADLRAHDEATRRERCAANFRDWQDKGALLRAMLAYNEAQIQSMVAERDRRLSRAAAPEAELWQMGVPVPYWYKI